MPRKGGVRRCRFGAAAKSGGLWGLPIIFALGVLNFRRDSGFRLRNATEVMRCPNLTS